MTEFCLEINNADKTFPGVQALDQANFKLKKGSIHALLGENGAGGMEFQLYIKKETLSDVFLSGKTFF